MLFVKAAEGDHVHTGSYRWVGAAMWARNNNNVHLNNCKQVFKHNGLQKLNPDRPDFYSDLQNDSPVSGDHILTAPSGWFSHRSAQNTSSVLQTQPLGFLFTSAWSHSSSNISNHVERSLLSLSGGLPAEYRHILVWDEMCGVRTVRQDEECRLVIMRDV